MDPSDRTDTEGYAVDNRKTLKSLLETGGAAGVSVQDGTALAHARFLINQAPAARGRAASKASNGTGHGRGEQHLPSTAAGLTRNLVKQFMPQREDGLYYTKSSGPTGQPWRQQSPRRWSRCMVGCPT